MCLCAHVHVFALLNRLIYTTHISSIHSTHICYYGRTMYLLRIKRTILIFVCDGSERISSGVEILQGVRILEHDT